MSHLARLVLVLLVSTLTACGGKSSASPDDDGQGGKAAGGTGSGGTGTSGTGTSGTGTSGTGSGGQAHAGSTGTGGADACSSFDDDSPGWVNVTISNQTLAPIYLGQDMVTCGVAPLFEVADASGAPLPGLGDCRMACVVLRQQGVGGCPAICAFPSAVALQPGEVLYTSWDTLFRVQGQLPAKCVPFDAGGETKVSCDQSKRIEPGTFTFSARAGSAIDCSQTTGTGSCSACAASPNGGCSTPGSLVTGPMHTARATVLLDERYGVYPNPGLNAGDAELPAPGGATAVLTVELIFTEK